MDKCIFCSIYSDELILVIYTICNILHIHNIYNCNDEFVIVFNCLFFFGLKVYLFTRYHWYERGVCRIECLSGVVDCSSIHIVLLVLLFIGVIQLFIYVYNHVIIMISHVISCILSLYSNSYLIVNSKLYDLDQ